MWQGLFSPVAPDALTNTARRGGLIALLSATFLMYTGFFMVIPLISVHYVDGLGWAAGAIGLVLAIRQFVQQGLTVFGGALADRIGAKVLICLGLLVRTFSFVLLAFAFNVPVLFIACFLAGIGGALFESPRTAAIAAMTRPDERQRFYSLNATLGSIGMAAGPFLGAQLLHLDFAIVCLVGASCYLLSMVQSLLTLPAVTVASSEERGFLQGIGKAVHDRPFVQLTALMMGYYFMWVQLNISMPLVAKAITGTSESIGLIYAVHSGFVILLQYPLMHLLGKRFEHLFLLTCGVLIMSLGIMSIALVQSLTGLIVSIMAFSLGALLVAPTQQTVTAGLSDPRALGSYFGVSALALGIGGGIGNFIGGILYQYGLSHGIPALPWIIFGVVGLVATLGLTILYLRQRRQRPDERAVASTA